MPRAKTDLFINPSFHTFHHNVWEIGKLQQFNVLYKFSIIIPQSSIVRTLDLFITLMETLLENHIWYEFIFEQVDLNLNSVSISIISVTVRWMKPMSDVIFTISASKLHNLIFLLITCDCHVHWPSIFALCALSPFCFKLKQKHNFKFLQSFTFAFCEYWQEFNMMVTVWNGNIKTPGGMCHIGWCLNWNGINVKYSAQWECTCENMI